MTRKVEAWLVEVAPGISHVWANREAARRFAMQPPGIRNGKVIPLVRRDPKVEAVLRQVSMLADYVSVNDEWDNAVPGGVRELVDLFAKYEASRKRKRRAKR